VKERLQVREVDNDENREEAAVVPTRILGFDVVSGLQAWVALAARDHRRSDEQGKSTDIHLTQSGSGEGRQIPFVCPIGEAADLAHSLDVLVLNLKDGRS